MHSARCGDGVWTGNGAVQRHDAGGSREDRSQLVSAVGTPSLRAAREEITSTQQDEDALTLVRRPLKQINDRLGERNRAALNTRHLLSPIASDPLPPTGTAKLRPPRELCRRRVRGR